MVAVYVCKLMLGTELERDDEMDGADAGPEWAVEEEEHAIDPDAGFVSHAQREDPQFEQRMAQLRLIASVYKLPVGEPKLEAGTYGGDTIHVNLRYCSCCGEEFQRLANAEAILVGQVSVFASLREDCLFANTSTRRPLGLPGSRGTTRWFPFSTFPRIIGRVVNLFLFKLRAANLCACTTRKPCTSFPSSGLMIDCPAGRRG